MIKAKEKIGCLLLVCLLVASVFVGNVSGEEDTTPPVLHEVIVTPTTVNADENITIKANVTDDISGVGYSIGAWVDSSLGYYDVEFLHYNTSSKYYEGKVYINQWAPNGTWCVDCISTEDNAGNRKNYYNGTDYNTTFIVINDGGGSQSTSTLIRTPENVSHLRPAIIFANVSGNYTNVSLSVDIRIDYEGPVYTGMWLKNYTIRMIPLLSSSGWYLTAIPGLPAKTFEGVLPGNNRTISSSVVYKLYADGTHIDSGWYNVAESNVSENIPPVVYAMDYDVLNDTSILEETLGLGPKGWTIDKNTKFKSLVLAFDNKGITKSDIEFRYSVNEGVWEEADVKEDQTLDILNCTVNYFNSDIIAQINNWLVGVGSILEVQLPLFIGYANIPGQQAGSYVEFYANATDDDGNTFSSPMGFYYIVNKTSSTKILTVDPNFNLWLMQENLERFVDVVQENSNYQIPENITNGFTRAKNLGEIIRKYGIIRFRHWEYLGENYDLYIAKADEKIPDLLGSFQPNVIFLSNVWNGFRKMDSCETGSWNWDLRDLGVDDDIINYTKNNHTGLIATHGTLSDWIIWSNPSEKYKVCTRGHVGYGMDDIDIEEKTIAHMLGLPMLAIYEEIRDAVATSLCADPLTEPLGLLVGSTPLQVPYIPFNGTMIRTSEGNYSGWDIPEEFYIEIPGFYQDFNLTENLTAYTQVGWQLGMPKVLAYDAWGKVEELKPYAQELYKNLSMLVQNVTNELISNRNITDRLNDSLVWALKNTYKSLISANISGQTFNLTLNVSNINATVESLVDRVIALALNAYETILQHLPVKLIAVSEDGLAGIITNDKYYDENGYRSAYFSFEIEAMEGETAKNLLIQAVEWSKDWQYNNTTELLGGLVRVGKDTAQKFEENITASSGTWLQNESLILNEEGNATVEMNLHEGSISTIIIAHPTTDSITAQILSGDAEIIDIQNLGNYITKIKVKSNITGEITIGFSANSDASLNPAYLTVKENRLPQITFYSPSANPTITEEENQTFNITALDPDNDTLTIQWYLNGGLVDTGDSYTFVSDYESAGIYIVNVTVSDGGYNVSHEWTLTVNNMNRPPVIETYSPETDPTITEEESQMFNITASDPDEYTVLIISWYLNDTIVLIPMDTAPAYIFEANYTSAGWYEVKVVVSDGELSVEHNWILTVTNVNRAPVIEHLEDQTAYEGTLFVLQVNASDPDNDDIAFSDDSELFDISIDGLISFTPDYESSGEYVINISVTDGEDLDYEFFTLTIVNMNRAPVVNSITANPTTVTEGGTATITVDATDEDTGDILTYHYDCTGGSISGTGPSVTWVAPSTAGDYTITVYVNDGKFDSNSKSVTITVISVNDAPIISGVPAQFGVEDVAWTLDVTLYISDVDNTTEELVVTVNSSYVTVDGKILTFLYPNGIIIDSVKITVSDGMATANKTITITITPVNDAPTISGIPTLYATEDTDLYLDVSPYISDVDNSSDELTVSTNSSYATVNGFVITFNYPNGILSENVRINVSDGINTSYQDIVVMVTPVNDEPVITSFTPTDNPTIDEAEEQTFTVSVSDVDNTDLTITWYLDGNSVAVGNAYAYTADYTSAGTYTVKVVVSDGSLTDEKTWTLTVNDVKKEEKGFIPSFETTTLIISLIAVCILLMRKRKY